MRVVDKTQFLSVKKDAFPGVLIEESPGVFCNLRGSLPVYNWTLLVTLAILALSALLSLVALILFCRNYGLFLTYDSYFTVEKVWEARWETLATFLRSLGSGSGSFFGSS